MALGTSCDEISMREGTGEEGAGDCGGVSKFLDTSVYVFRH